MAQGQFQSTKHGNQFVGIELTGTDKLAAVLRKLGQDAPVKLGDALYRQAEFLMTEAKNLTPVDTGALRSSGHVELPTVEGSKVQVVLGFGGPAGGGTIDGVQGPVMPGAVLTKEGERDPGGYAIIVHEDLTAHHEVGQAKFLEQPALELAGKLEGKLAADLKKDLEDLGK